LPRFVTSDGRTVVDVISLTLTGTGRDGRWFRIRHDGYFYAEVRTCAELGRLVNLADLRELLLRLLLCLPGAPLRFRCV
jgi:hypothetical protein